MENSSLANMKERCDTARQWNFRLGKDTSVFKPFFTSPNNLLEIFHLEFFLCKIH